ncbi:translation initiation factor IF-2-like [Schistocerca piceifrons]|uniref:translation initiation factor IF-2-like n=1 Tax=Schistocerca piceifrons TaxID=274613 RepID=UPI001F5FA1D7|nr:translation initiation factor IF-2-like [Schistocerca piceifrons]
MRVGRGRQAASLAATVGVVNHGAAAPLVDAPKAARPADAPDASVADNEWHVVTPRRDRRRAAGRRPPPPDRRRIIPPSPPNSGPARANAPGRPARAKPPVSRAGGRARATAGPSVGGAANNSRGALGPSARPARATPGGARPARATPATSTTTAPSGSDRRAPSPRNSGPGRAGASGLPARATPRVSCAGGGPLATAGPSVGGAANTSRGAPDPSARPAQATPAPAATAAPPVTTGAAIESSTARPTPDGSTAPPPTQMTEQRDVNGGTAAAFPRRGSRKRRCRRRNNRPSPDPPPQNSRPSPNLTDPLVHDKQWWDAFVAVVEDFISEIAETKPQRQAAGGRQDGPPAAAHRGQGRADAAANPPPPAPTRGRGGQRGGRGARRAAAAKRRYDANAASEIQKLYRADRRKAMQRVLGETSPYCQIDGNVLTEHFKKVYAKSDFSVSDAPAAVPDFAATTPPDVSEEVLPPITPSEV